MLPESSVRERLRNITHIKGEECVELAMQVSKNRLTEQKLLIIHIDLRNSWVLNVSNLDYCRAHIGGKGILI